MSMSVVDEVIPEVIYRPVCDVVVELPDDDLPLLLSGDMTQLTLPYRLEVDYGSYIDALFRVSGEKLRLYVLSFGGKFFKELNIRDAYQSGFNSLECFKDRLSECYGCQPWTPLYYYIIKVVL